MNETMRRLTQPRLTPEQRARFRVLASALSPENLTCDGELSRSAVRAKERGLRAEWRALEAQVGRKVSETEAWYG